MPQIAIASNGSFEPIQVDDVQTYLDGLPPENIRVIRISDCELTVVSNLYRFTNLVYLDCALNQLISLPELPYSLLYLNCHHNQITSLPALPKSLESLYCERNQLRTLPALPKSLKNLDCQHNQLISLPALPKILISVNCERNQLISLPELPESLEYFDCQHNPISDIIEDLYFGSDIPLVRSTINKLIRIKHLCYCLKFKLKFIQLFLRSQEKKIMEQNHPNKIVELLDNGVEIDDLEKHL